MLLDVFWLIVFLDDSAEFDRITALLSPCILSNNTSLLNMETFTIFYTMRSMGLDDLLDNTEKCSQHLVMYDKQMLQITLVPQVTVHATRSMIPHVWLTSFKELHI